MNIIEYLKMLDPKQNVTIWLREDIKDSQDYNLQMIADTTTDVLLKSTKEGFRKLNVVSVVSEENHSVIIVKNPKVAH